METRSVPFQLLQQAGQAPSACTMCSIYARNPGKEMSQDYLLATLVREYPSVGATTWEHATF
jgi:hypothetical protein